jgi:hypothetical protein
LALARQIAVSKSSLQAVQFTPATGVYTLPGVNDINRANLTYSVNLADSPFNVSLPAVVLGADSNIQFDYYGQPDSGGVITVRSGSYQQTVSVDAGTGLASIP